MARQGKCIVLLLWVAGFSACHRSPQPSPQAAYDTVRLEIQHGELKEAQAEADHYWHVQQTPEWAWKFRVLEAEILEMRGISHDALTLLTPEVPASLSTDEVAVRRKLVQSLTTPQYADAKRLLDEAEQLAQTQQPQLLPEVGYCKGRLLLRGSNFADAQTALLQALFLARREAKRFLEVRIQINLGLAAMKRQHYGEAIDWDKSALALAQSLEARALVTKIMGNLASCYHRMGDLDAALELFNKVEALSSELGLRNDQLLWLISIGNIHYERLQLEDAQNDYLSALNIAKEKGIEDRSEQAICLGNLANIAIDKQQLEEAERYNEAGLKLAREDHNRVSELYSLYNEARILTHQAKFSQAKQLLLQVIEGTKSQQDTYLEWITQVEFANLYAAQKQVMPAEQQFRKVLAIMNKVRSSNPEEYRLSFASTAVRFYDTYITFLVGQGKINEALHVVELNRAQTLLEGLGVSQSENRWSSSVFRPERIAKQTNTVILCYWLAPDNSYLWAITPTKVSLFALPPQSEIEQAVHSYRTALTGPRDVREIADVNGQKLYSMLIEPAQKLIPNGAQVVIIPDGSLYELNFETLLVPGNQLHYWIEDAVVTNSSSLLLLQEAQTKRTSVKKDLLLIGDPVSRDTEFTMLPQAASEMDQIKKYFPANQVQTYAGRNATAKSYLAGDPGKYSFIHFVAHGVASRESPLDSAVILSGEENANKLYARDIVKVKLQASLVTISSCQGAAGRTYAGEGLVGLSWAFLRAGAHQVIAALWEVNDAATPEFMHEFYAAISAGSDPAVALRTAKLSMLHSDSIYRKPFYWAPFQLYKGL